MFAKHLTVRYRLPVQIYDIDLSKVLARVNKK